MKKLFVVLFAAILMFSLLAVAGDKKAASDKASSWTGIITDKNCSSKPSATDEACAKRCIERDKAAVFVNDADKSVVPIHNVDAIKGHEGHHVKVTGSMMDKALHVDKVEMVENK